MDKKRFEQFHYEMLDSPFFKSSANAIEIIKDLETGVLYCVANKQNGISMTPLLDSEGKPIIDKSE